MAVWKMVKFGQIWKWSYSKHVYEIPYAVCETAWEPSERLYGPDLDRVNYGPRNNSGEVDQLTFWQPKICAVKIQPFFLQAISIQIIVFSTQKVPTKGWTWEKIISGEYLWCLLRSKMKRY